MPWTLASAMDMRTRFIGDYLRQSFSFAELCRRYGISRKTGYKWVARYEREGAAGLAERSHRTHSCPHKTAAPIVRALLELRHHHPTWNAKKPLAVLRRRHPDWTLPARSTAHDLLKRHGLIPRRRRRPKRSHPGRPNTPFDQPSAVLDGRLERAVPPSQRALLLSLDGGRWLQPLPARL